MGIRLKPPCLPALLLLLSACGSPHSPVSSHTTPAGAPQAAAPKPAGDGSDALEQDTVAAVSPGGSGPPVGLRFRLDTRPVVGMPAQLVLSLIPSPGVEISHIHGALQAAEGLQVQSPHTFDIERPQSGVPIHEDVTVLPQRNGVLSFSATLDIDYGDNSLSRTYVIPLIATGNAS